MRFARTWPRSCAVVLVGLTGCVGGAGEAGSSSSSPTPSMSSTTVASTTAVSTTEAPPVTAQTAAPSEPGVTPEGFDQRGATITTPDGEVCEICLWVADHDEDRRRGLMFVDSLGDADGMAFVYEAPRTGSFWMKNTLLPLTIAYFGADGEFLEAVNMEPCEADPCPSYPTAPDFVTAIEFVQGTAPDFGVGPGATFAWTDSASCPG